MTYPGGLWRFGRAEHLVGVQVLLEHSFIADGDGNDVQVRDPTGVEQIQVGRQQT